VASSPARGEAPPPPKTNHERPQIVVLGDSLTAGLGLLDTESYPHVLQEKIDRDGFKYQVVNAGVSGDTSAGGLRRLDWALEGDVRVLILALGANDGLRGLPVAEMKTNLARIIEAARAKNIVVILAGMEAPPNYGPEYAAASARRTAISRGSITFNSYRFSSTKLPVKRRSIREMAYTPTHKERQSWQTRSGTC